MAVSLQQPSPQQTAQIQQVVAQNQTATVVGTASVVNTVGDPSAGTSNATVMQAGQQVTTQQGIAQITSTQVRNIVKKRIQSNVKVTKNQ